MIHSDPMTRLPLALLLAVSVAAPLRLAGEETFKSKVTPFLEAHCTACHGQEKSKGKVTLHDLDGDFSSAQELERWELVLDMLRSGEMPPEDKPQPEESERGAVSAWIEEGLRQAISRTEGSPGAPLVRRLTNFEYQNTMRDLLGFELNLTENLPDDPVEPYAFNNTADLMRLGPEQLDRYLENARRAMASAIVDPGKPEVHRTRVEWKPHGLDRGLGGDEVGIWGNRRNTPATGMGLRSFPETGEFRIRIKASAILPEGVRELPLRLVMGYGLNRNSSTLQVEPVGTLTLRESPDAPVVSEFRGRIENFPAETNRAHRGKSLPDAMTITPQNLYDDGTLNDDNDFSRTRNISMPRAVVEWIEFEAPITDPWPPAHHTRILFDSPLRESDPAAYVRTVLERFTSRAYRRPASDDEVDRFVNVYGTRWHRNSVRWRRRCARLWRWCWSRHSSFATHDGLRAGSSLASRLSYFLWGSMPDDELLRLAAGQKLDDPEVMETQVRRLLKDDRSADFVRNFTMQWLSLEKMKTVPINQELFPRFLYYVATRRARRDRGALPADHPRSHDRRDARVRRRAAPRQRLSVLNIVDSNFALAQSTAGRPLRGRRRRGTRIAPRPAASRSTGSAASSPTARC